MIGQLLAMKFVGKKKWTTSIVYWILAMVTWIFVILIAKFIYPKMSWQQSIKVWLIGFVIDIIILAVLWTVFFEAYFATWFGGLWPFGDLLGFL